MLRESTSTVIRSRSDVSEVDLLREAIRSFDPSTCQCQACGTLNLKVTSTYKRGISTIHNGEPVDEIIHIPCVTCEGCGGYRHAVLFDLIVPYSSYTLLYILTVLCAYFNRTVTVPEVCARWHISVPTIYVWRQRFIEHYNLWAPVLERIDERRRRLKKKQDRIASGKFIRNAVERILSLLEPEPRFARSFFLTFTFSFLQSNHKTHSKHLPLKCQCT